MNWLLQLIPLAIQLTMKIIDAARQHRADDYDQHEPVANSNDVVYVTDEQLSELRKGAPHGR